MNAITLRALAVVAALAALVWGCIYGVGKIKADGAQAQKTAEAAQLAKDSQAARAKEQAFAVAQQESDHEADVFNARAAADRIAAAGASARLQQRFSATDHCGMPGHPATVAAGASAGAPADLRADMLRRLVEAAGQLASYADAARAAGDNAQRQHDALKGTP